jgi:hypothetical protein
LPTEDAVRIALRTQQIIAHKTGARNTIDPVRNCVTLVIASRRDERGRRRPRRGMLVGHAGAHHINKAATSDADHRCAKCGR